MLIMAIDLGDKRTGLAIGDEGTGTAMPVEVLEVARGPALSMPWPRRSVHMAPDASLSDYHSTWTAPKAIVRDYVVNSGMNCSR